MAIYSVETKRGLILWIAVIATATEWLASYFDLKFLIILSYGVNIVFFAIVVFKMIFEIAKTKDVNIRVIIEAINCYLLIGLIFSLLVTFVAVFDIDAYNFTWINNSNWQEVSHVSEFLYYTFVTFTTLGYGDVVPQTPAARSLAILISITGQIYIAIIIALLVGKYASKQTD
jgi:voltage-gated potassium channel Kch